MFITSQSVSVIGGVFVIQLTLVIVCFALQLKKINFENISWKQHSVWCCTKCLDFTLFFVRIWWQKMVQFTQCEAFRLISHYSRASNQIAKYPQRTWLPHSVTEKYRKLCPESYLLFDWSIYPFYNWLGPFTTPQCLCWKRGFYNKGKRHYMVAQRK